VLTAAAQHALLGLSIAALAGASLRLASLSGSRGIDRAIAALPLAAAAAVLEALLLGLFGIGTNPIALGAAAAATWLLVRARVPAASPRPVDELAGWWREQGPLARTGAGALTGALLAFGAWLMRYPGIGQDGLSYHLPAIAGWVQSGSPGAVVDYFDDLPTGSYPITHEVLLSWSVGISRSLVTLTLWPVTTLVMLAVAGWHALRSLRVPRPMAGLTVAALVTSPLLVVQVNGIYTDLPALAWLVVAGALCAAATARPAMLAPAIVAAGLAVGTKATPLAPAVAALAAAAFVARRELRPLARPLALAALAALVVGGTWFVRNLIVHGSPLWPLMATPFGDPVPPVLEQIDGRLISDLGSIPPRSGEYAGVVSGSLLLLAGALIAPLVARRREVALAAAVAGACMLIWASAPYTGYPRGEGFDSLAAGAARYLLPAIAASALAVALAARSGGRAALLPALVFLAAAAWNLERDLELGFPSLPSAPVIAAGALVGALAGLAACARVALRAPPSLALAAIVVVAGALLALPAGGYVERHMRVVPIAGGYASWIAARPGFRDGDRPVSAAGSVNGALVGDRLSHPVRLIPPKESCARLRRRVAEEWVALPIPQPHPLFEIPPASLRRVVRLHRCLAAVSPAYRDHGYLVYGSG